MKTTNLRYELQQEEIIKYQKKSEYFIIIISAFHTKNYYIFDFFTIWCYQSDDISYLIY